jgi:FtsH-binding integral membrane protein
MPSAPEKDLFSHLSNFTLPISTRARQHLTKVYSTLLLTITCAALGSFFHLHYHIGGTLTHLLSFILLMSIGATSVAHPSPSSSQYIKGLPNSLLLLAAYGFCQGASLGPLIEMAVYIDPSLIITAFVLTANIFFCFTLTSLFIPRRSLMALASLLSSSLTFLVCLSLLSIFFPTVWAYKVQLYLGLVTFCGYIIVDTQSIIDGAEKGGADYVKDGLRLFTNVVAIFVRLLIVLMEQAAKGERDGDRKKRGATVRR